MTPPIWLDAAGRPRPTRACWTCGREVAPMRFRAGDLRPHGWAPPQTLHIPDCCGLHGEVSASTRGTPIWLESHRSAVWNQDRRPRPAPGAGDTRSRVAVRKAA